MYIRSSTQKDSKTGSPYTTFRLVETYRNASGKVRQHTLLNLGANYAIPKNDWKLLANRIEEILSNQQSLFSLELDLEKEAQRITKLICHKYSKKPLPQITQQEKITTPAGVDLKTVDVNSIQHHTARKVGAEHLALHAATQLQLQDILAQTGFNQKKNHLALASIIGRLIHPGSELRTHKYLTEQSALDELMGTNFSSLSLKGFYQIADELIKHKNTIEKALYQREKDLFNLKEIVTLYDITNTYFEGRCLNNPKALYGRSKEKRSDCPLVSLGLILDSSGFIKKSSILPGNVSEPKTLQEILKTLGAEKQATIIMDAGFATEENIQWLKDSEYKYIVVSRKNQLSMPDEADTVVVKDIPGNKVQASLIENKDSDELELYCHSQAKEEKTLAMESKAELRFEDELKKISQGLNKKGSVKKYSKVMEKIGRLREKYSRIAKHYSVETIPDEHKIHAVSIKWEKNKLLKKTQGVYCLRTNRKDFDEKTLWETYTMLTEVESTFRSLKSELGFRPVYHQNETRVDGHLFISILAYHLLHTIRYQLKNNNISANWETIRQALDTQFRVTSTMKLENNQTLSLRKTTMPNPEQLAIYQALEINSVPGSTEKSIF